MGMLIDGKWDDAADQSMVLGMYRREQSALPTSIDAQVLEQIGTERDRFFLIASASCPWSHGAVIALVLGGLMDTVDIQWAGGPRREGYGLLPGGPLPNRSEFQHVHQFYTSTIATYTGRSTVPVLWDAKLGNILSNSSADIMAAFDVLSAHIDLCPAQLHSEITELKQYIFDGLSNAVYRAGKSQRQDEYDQAVNTVFDTLDQLETRLDGQPFLFGDALTQADIRLFATLVRFDTVYATHFRCTRKRLVEYPNLWQFTRRIFQMPGIRQTVDFDEIRFGYYINDGDHNPYGLIGQQPEIDWESQEGL
ncbi:glutathione S-transferase C-terminal domain-containing protein [Phaeobacter porticola]|uniref:Glutathione transferase-like protein n=1 Tax=Phaeobacter porticola TaxID=1844006 RepID=A0A1L3I605_9RHOB|nr:glutathione S-transferase C-terminal domain-containing protein [Phaeobacter porticola]APG47559.1 glutathione transferase-like protein [Phaeobacter porticola]